jgi:hypothetical protein
MLVLPSVLVKSPLAHLPALISEFPSRPYLHCLHPPLLQKKQACYEHMHSRSRFLNQNQSNHEVPHHAVFTGGTFPKVQHSVRPETTEHGFHGFRRERSTSEAIDSLCCLSLHVPGHPNVIEEQCSSGYPPLTEAARHPSHLGETQFISSVLQEGMSQRNLSSSREQVMNAGIEPRSSVFQIMQSANCSYSNDCPVNQSSPRTLSCPEAPEGNAVYEYQGRMANSSEGSLTPGRHIENDRFHARRCPFLGCAKILCRSSYLKAHMRLHTRERPYCCVVTSCAMRFRWKSNLTRHLRAGHDIPSPF